MKKTSAFAIALLAPSMAFAAVKLETTIQLGGDKIEKTVVLEEGQHESFDHKDYTIDVTAQVEGDETVVNMKVSTKDEDGNSKVICEPTLRTKLGKEATLECPSKNIDTSYSMTVIATQE